MKSKESKLTIQTVNRIISVIEKNQKRNDWKLLLNMAKLLLANVGIWEKKRDFYIGNEIDH